MIWNRQSKLGKVFDSSTGFKLPNGADHSPDVAWVRQERWDALTLEQKEKFPPIAPDFVLELMSPTDNVSSGSDGFVAVNWLKRRKYVSDFLKTTTVECGFQLIPNSR